MPGKPLPGMIRRRPWLAHLVALLLLLHWGTAFAHCLRPLAAVGAAHSVEICGAGELTTALLDDDGHPIRKPAAQPVCPGCCGPVALGPLAPARMSGPVVWLGEASPPLHEGLPIA